MKLKLIAVACLSLTLISCGGGGGGSGGNSTSNPITADLVLSATVNGIPVQNFSVKDGESKVLGLNSGERVEITASVPADAQLSPNGAVEAGATRSDTTYAATLTVIDHTLAKLTVTSRADQRKTAIVTLAIKGDKADFKAVVPVVNDTFVYSEDVIQVNNAPFAFGNTIRRVDAVSAAGWRETYLTPAAVPIATVNLTIEGNRTGYEALGTAAGCNNRNEKFARFTPEERLLAFPLALGNTYAGNWITSCGAGGAATPTDSQNEAIVANVLRFEKITTPAGVFNAMLINQDTTVTNSTNTVLPGGGYTQNVQVWFDPVLGRNVKYIGTRSYTGTPNGSLVKQTTIQLVGVSKQ